MTALPADVTSPEASTITSEAIDDLFHDSGRDRKGEFAFALATALRESMTTGPEPTVPGHLEALFSYLYPAPDAKDDTTDATAVPH